MQEFGVSCWLPNDYSGQDAWLLKHEAIGNGCHFGAVETGRRQHNVAEELKGFVGRALYWMMGMQNRIMGFDRAIEVQN